MAEVKWIKITTDMFEDEKIDFIQSLPEGDAMLVIWIRLLTMAGKCNANGYIFLTENIPYTEEMLAYKFKKSLNVVRLALDTFQRLSMVQMDEIGLSLSNWAKYQNLEGMDKIKEKEKARLRKQKERDRKKQLKAPYQEEVILDDGMSRDSHSDNIPNVTVTPSKKEQEQDKDKELDIDNSCCCNEEDYVNTLIKHYCDKALILETNIKAKDLEIALELFTTVPIDIAISGIDESFENYKSKFVGDKINSMAYCKPIILSLYEKEKAKEANKGGGSNQSRADNKQNTSKLKIPKPKYEEFTDEQLREAGLL